MINCFNCNVICYDNCMIVDDDKKYECLIMNEVGNCKICFYKCVWLDYKNVKFCFKYVIEIIIKIYIEMKKIYEEGLEKNVLYEY